MSTARLPASQSNAPSHPMRRRGGDGGDAAAAAAEQHPNNNNKPSSSKKERKGGSGGGGLLRYWRLIALIVGAGAFYLSHAREYWGPPPSVWISLKRAFWAAYLCTYLDVASPKDGSRAWPWFQRLPWWRILCTILRGRVVMEAPLDPNRQYIFGAHPHGINTWNHFLTMTNGCGFLSQHYPKPRRDLAASVLFLIPFCKDVLLWLGCVDAGPATAHKVLREGFSTLIYVGGEKEQILTERGRDVVVVTPRKGFLKLALQYGCDVVPYFAFGESDLYLTLNKGAHFQLWLASTYKIAFPPCWGFFLPFWPIPARLTVVCGPPIRVAKTESPTPAQIDALQQQYIQALTALYDRHKVEHGGRRPDAVLDVR